MIAQEKYEKFAAAVIARHRSTTPSSAAADPEEVVEVIRRGLEFNLTAVAPKNCGIDKITAVRIGWDEEAAEDFENYIGLPGPLFRLDGHDREKLRPLRVQLLFMDSDIHVTFILTPGHDASSVYYGQKRTCRHAAVVLALFGLSVIRLYAYGYRRIIDTPIDDNVRKLYMKMGFKNGEVLDLVDQANIQMLVDFVVRGMIPFNLDPSPLCY